MTVSLPARFLCLVLALSWLLGASPDAHAESPEAEAANVLYTDGKAAFERGRYGQALNLFQQAYEVIQNDFIRFYLGRAHTALNQCEQALTHFNALSQRLPSAPREQRREDEVRCRLRLAAGYLEGYRCHESLETLKPIDRRLKHPDNRRQFAALQATGKQCTDVFGTRTVVGQRAARFYAEARSALRKGNTPRALKLADKSLAAKPSRPAAAVEAIALGKLGRCQAAIPRLEVAVPNANAEDAHIMGELSVRCRLSEGKRLLKGGSCYQIIRMLEPLKGKLKGEQETWRRQKVSWCRPRATAFPTDTTTRKAAYTLFRAAREAHDGGAPDAPKRAAVLYAKALKLTEEPVIRRELAAVQIASSGCPASQETLRLIPEDVQVDWDRAMLETCRRYPPEPALEGAELDVHVRGVLEVLALREAGVHLQALSRLDALVTKVSPGIQGLKADLLYGAGRCDDYVRQVQGMAATLRARVTDSEIRLSECRTPLREQPVATLAEPHAAPRSHESRVQASAQSMGADTRHLAPWLTLGSGAALGAAGLALTFAWLDAEGRHEDARSRYESGAGDDALAALEEMNALADEGALHSGLALGLGAAGAVALGVGLVLLLSDSPDAPREVDPTLSLYPVVSPSHVGLRGSF
jgi:tetratricopeptide (TPR) repeat protein